LKIFITGGTGTLGKTLLPHLLSDGHQVIVYSRDEQKQAQLPHDLGLVKYLGCVRDYRRVIEASRDCDLVFHLAALKMVDVGETNPEEFIHTNIVGTQNILYAQRVNKIPKVVLVSTDKAVAPINLYGATKLAAERLVLRNPSNAVCRYGNVLGSRGSVVPKFIASLKAGKRIEITDSHMTRFWITAQDAANFVLRAGLIGAKHGLLIPEMKAYPIVDLAEVLGKILGESPRFTDIGLRPGEKIHEQLRLDSEGGAFFSHEKYRRYSDGTMTQMLKAFMEGHYQVPSPLPKRWGI